MEKEQSNPEFNFLFDTRCPEHAYYRWRIFSLAAGDTLRRWGGGAVLESKASRLPRAALDTGRRLSPSLCEGWHPVRWPQQHGHVDVLPAHYYQLVTIPPLTAPSASPRCPPTAAGVWTCSRWWTSPTAGSRPL